LLYFTYQLDLSYAIADAAIFNGVFAIMGTSLWYLVQYSTISEKRYLYILMHHTSIGIIFILCWYGICTLLLSFMFGNAIEYIDFLRSTFTWRLAFGTMFYVALFLAFYSFKVNDFLKEKELQQAQLSNYLREAELRSLKSQLNPHFIFNSLNSINSLTISAPEKAREMVVKLSEFLRYSLKREGESDLAKLSEELENARRYLDIEKVRFGKNLIYKEEVCDKCLNIPVPSYVLQPLLENAIKHGVYDSLKPVEIHLKCGQIDDNLFLTLTNNFDKEPGKLRKGEGIGLRNIRNRLRLIYGNENLMKVYEHNGHFVVSLIIPQTIRS
jgi:two-component system, LytTR family, sensor kinase